jgi:hypothetical protein
MCICLFSECMIRAYLYIYSVCVCVYYRSMQNIFEIFAICEICLKKKNNYWEYIWNIGTIFGICPIIEICAIIQIL